MKFNLKRSVLVVSSLLCVSYLVPSVDAQANATTTRATTTTQAQTTTEQQTTTTLPPTTTQAPTTRSAAPTTVRTSQSTTSTLGPVPPPGSGNCTSTAQCPVNKLCAITALGQTAGQCIDMPANICYSTPATSCSQNSDCNNAFFSYCATDIGVCAGLGDPARPETQCGNGSNQNVQTKTDGSVMQTAKWAGIAVGCVAAFGAVFALVRWQRRRKRAKMPVSMFGEIDYGTDRPGPGASGGQYPFSNRNNAHGPDAEYYDDAAYYDDGYGQNNNAHAMTGMGQDQGYYGNGGGGGGAGYDAPGYDQGYYAKDGYDAGYDTGYGGAPGGAGGYDNAYYDQSGYNTQGYGGAPGINEPPAAARALSPTNRGGYNTAGDYSVDNYGVEPSELDFGGGQGANNQRYY